MRELRRDEAPGDALDDLLRFIMENPREDLSVKTLAARAGMGDRRLRRALERRFGATPSDLVERSRVEAARRILETEDVPLDEVARRSGFGATITLARAFRRAFDTTPARHRARTRLERLRNGPR